MIEAKETLVGQISSNQNLSGELLPRGPKGDKGEKGDKGDKGDTGAKGADGKDGAIQYEAGENITIEGNVISAKGGGGGINVVEVKGQTIDLIDYEEPTIIHLTFFNTYIAYNKENIVINNKYLSFSKNQTRALIYWSGTKFLNTATNDKPALLVVLNNSPLQIQKNNYNYTILDTIKFILLPTGKIYGELQSNDLMLQNNSETIYGEKTFITLPKSSVNPTSADQFTRKGYVDSLPTTYAGYDATKTQVLKNMNGTLTWVDE